MEVARLYLGELKTQQEIADSLGVDQSTVSRDLQALHDAWVERAQKEVASYKAEHLARLEQLAGITFKKATAEGCGDMARVAYIDTLRRIYADIAKLLGLEDIKLQVTGELGADTLRHLLGISDHDDAT